MRDETAGGFSGFPKIARRDHEHPRKRAEGRQVLRGVVRRAEGSVAHATTYTDDLDIRTVVADIVAYLLETAERWKIADGIREYSVALKSQTGGEARHVLLSNADVEELARVASDEIVQDTKAEI